jgi:5-methylcytosine-specific restriction endonuclease McrA
MKLRYSKELLEPIVKQVTSMRQLLYKLNLKPTGGNYQNIKSKLSLYSIDCSHWTGQRSNIGNIQGTLKSSKLFLKDVLTRNSSYQSSKLRVRLLKENIIENVCVICDQGPVWNNKPLTLQLDHIDGNRNNNCLENLRLLCPNCHTQTPTHSGKNKARMPIPPR